MNKKMVIARDSQKTNEEKLKALSDLCYKSGKTFTVATKNGAYLFEKEGDSVRIKYAEKIYRIAEEKEQGICRYSFNNARVSGITYNRFGYQKKEDFGLFDEVNRMSNEKDAFSTEIKNLDGIIEDGPEYIAEADVNKVTLTKNLNEEQELNQKILTGDTEQIKQNIQEVLNKAQMEDLEQKLNTYIIPNGMIKLSEFPVNENNTTYGIIKNLNVVHTKKTGEKMAYFELADGQESIACVCFPNKYKNMENVLKEGAGFNISGKLKEEFPKGAGEHAEKIKKIYVDFAVPLFEKTQTVEKESIFWDFGNTTNETVPLSIEEQIASLPDSYEDRNEDDSLLYMGKEKDDFER